MQTTDSQTLAIEPAAADQHFLFRCEQSWFSIPAINIREVTVAPEFVTVPGCDAVVEGLCRQQSEFIPVISLAVLLDLESDENRAEHNQLLTLRTGAVWAIRIAAAAGLEMLDTIAASDLHNGPGEPSCIVGTATCDQGVIRVLNAECLYQQAQRRLDCHWRRLQLGSNPTFSLSGDQR